MYYKSTRDSSVRVESAVAISQGISADGDGERGGDRNDSG